MWGESNDKGYEGYESIADTGVSVVGPGPSDAETGETTLLVRQNEKDRKGYH